MNTILLLLLTFCEIAFAVLSIAKQISKKRWNQCRVMVATAELLIFFASFLLPGIDLGMRFKLLFVILILRIVWSVLWAICLRKKGEEKKKTGGIIFHGFGAIVVMSLSLIPSFVFADYQGIPTSGSYEVATEHGILVDTNRVEIFESDGSSREVPLYLYYPANVAQKEKYPVVFFSHGAFGYYQSNTSTYMELASNGYVVVSVEHPYHSLFTKDTDGKTIIVDQTFLNDAFRINEEGAMSEQEIVDITSQWLELRVDDLNFVVDTIKRSADAKTLPVEWVCENPEAIKEALSHCDFEHIGMMGHSLGGASSVELGRVRTDIDAVIDFDGTMIGEIIGVAEDGIHDMIEKEPYETPILSFNNEEHHNESVKCLENGEEYANNVLLANAKEGYETYIAHTGHMNYTDLPLFSPGLAKMLGVGSVDAKACVKKMNELTLSFFNHYLKDKGEFSVDECYELSES